MSAGSYSEVQFAEQRAIGLLGERGWQTVSATGKVFGASGTVGREMPGAAVFESRPRTARTQARFPACRTRCRDTLSRNAASPEEIFRL